MSEWERVGLDDFNELPRDYPAASQNGDGVVEIETLRAFLERDLPPAEALVGHARDGTNLLPRFGWVMPWGREGSSKTTLLLDLLFHACAGLSWLDHYPTARPLRVVAVVNEGIPGGLQDKLRQKVELWAGDTDAVLDNLAIYASPWGAFTFRNEQIVQHAQDYCRDFGADYIAFDPLHTLGTNGAGSPQDTEAFKHALRAFGLWDWIGVVTAHHSNKGGMVSGDWARHPDTVLRVEKDGKNPATKLTLEKARPADPMELGVPVLLRWVTDAMGYERLELPDRRSAEADDVVLEKIIRAVAEADEPLTMGALKKVVGGDHHRLSELAKQALSDGLIRDVSTHGGRFAFAVPDLPGDDLFTAATAYGSNEAETRMDSGDEFGDW